jgi:hypothetical protein
MNRPLAWLLASTALAVASAATAQTVDAWDADGDGMLDEGEFRANFSDGSTFGQWDRDGDGQIGSGEFADGLFRAWDLDDDGTLSIDEWDASVDLWLGESDVDLSAQAWDEDGDGEISRREFTATLQATDLFGRAELDDDADELLDEDEFTAGIFDLVDIDGDAVAGEQEEGLLVDLLEAFDPAEADAPGAGDESAALGAADPELDPFGSGERLIERGEAFMQLPIPCGGEGGSACEEIAERFCSALGYGAPIDFVSTQGQVYVIRCHDEI